MADTSKLRMNLAAIKRVDPYAKDIVDSTAHVAFYTFNSCENEWEKTDVEGAFFIYSRNAEPFHSIFINNRLNTNSFVEPITGQLELQSQPPFLLYRNERSRIRGFWFYSSLECDRIGQIVTVLVQRCDTGKLSEPDKQNNINIFNMLTKAQQDFSNSQNILSSVQDVASHNVLKFFASAKPASVSENQFFQRVFPNTLSVQQLEKQQRVRSPSVDTTLTHALHKFNSKIDYKNRALTNSPNLTINATPDLEMSPFSKFFIPCTAAKQINLSNLEDAPAKEKCYLRKLLNDIPIYESDSIKPALMPPTMFEKSENFSKTNGQTYMDSNEGKNLAISRKRSRSKSNNRSDSTFSVDDLKSSEKKNLQLTEIEFQNKFESKKGNGNISRNCKRTATYNILNRVIENDAIYNIKEKNVSKDVDYGNKVVTSQLTKPKFANVGRISKAGIKIRLLNAQLKVNIDTKLNVASAFNNDTDEDTEEMPAECKMRMRNIGRDTPTSSGPNTFGKTKQGFIDSRKVFGKLLRDKPMN